VVLLLSMTSSRDWPWKKLAQAHSVPAFILQQGLCLFALPSPFFSAAETGH
jgi:hypothetical protein